MIYITGAGCGDFSLLTLKARWALEHADLVLYDRLLDPTMLSFVTPTCVCTYVGKRNHHHTLAQEDIARYMVEAAQQYPIIVRLKGGDPYVFGRGGEEALYLQEHGIAFEVIPGITSAIAGCGSAGIPVTHRGVSLGVHIVTAHDKNDQLADLDFAFMAKTNETLVFLMGLASVGDIVAKLLAHGKDPSTPIALISNAAQSNQASVIATLASIMDVDRRCIVSPALIVVGDVVRFHQRLCTNSKKPLHGKRYLLAALQKEESMQWQFMMEGACLEVVRCVHLQEFPAALSNVAVASYTHILFTSRNAVTFFFKQWLAMGQDVRSLHACRLCAIGEKTAAILQQYGCRCDMVSPIANSEGFAQYMQTHVQSRDRLLLPKAKSEHTIDTLQAQLAPICHVDVVYLYQSVQDPVDIEPHAVDGVLFTCTSGVHALWKHIKAWDNIQQTTMYAIGEPTKRALQQYGCKHIVMLPHADKAFFIQAVKEEEAHV